MVPSLNPQDSDPATPLGWWGRDELPPDDSAELLAHHEAEREAARDAYEYAERMLGERCFD